MYRYRMIICLFFFRYIDAFDRYSIFFMNGSTVLTIMPVLRREFGSVQSKNARLCDIE